MRGGEAISPIDEKVDSQQSWRAFGEYLRRERELRGVDVGQIAQQTKYSVHQLQRLEAGDPGAFAAHVFIAGAVKGYAQCIGADPAQMHLHLLEVVQEMGPNAWGERLPERPSRADWGGKITAGWPVVLVLVALAGLLIWWWAQ